MSEPAQSWPVSRGETGPGKKAPQAARGIKGAAKQLRSAKISQKRAQRASKFEFDPAKLLTSLSRAHADNESGPIMSSPVNKHGRKMAIQIGTLLQYSCTENGSGDKRSVMFEAIVDSEGGRKLPTAEQQAAAKEVVARFARQVSGKAVEDVVKEQKETVARIRERKAAEAAGRPIDRKLRKLYPAADDDEDEDDEDEKAGAGASAAATASKGGSRRDKRGKVAAAAAAAPPREFTAFVRSSAVWVDGKLQDPAAAAAEVEAEEAASAHDEEEEQHDTDDAEDDSEDDSGSEESGSSDGGGARNGSPAARGGAGASSDTDTDADSDSNSDSDSGDSEDSRHRRRIGTRASPPAASASADADGDAADEAVAEALGKLHIGIGAPHAVAPAEPAVAATAAAAAAASSMVFSPSWEATTRGIGSKLLARMGYAGGALGRGGSGAAAAAAAAAPALAAPSPTAAATAIPAAATAAVLSAESYMPAPLEGVVKKGRAGIGADE